MFNTYFIYREKDDLKDSKLMQYSKESYKFFTNELVKVSIKRKKSYKLEIREYSDDNTYNIISTEYIDENSKEKP